MIMDTSMTNKILTFFQPDFTDVAVSSFEVKLRKKHCGKAHLSKVNFTKQTKSFKSE